jgi:hypothetical protein
MGTGLSHRNPPALTGGEVNGDEVVYHRDIKFSAESFEAELADWVGRYMTRSRVAVLMRDADGLKEVIDYLKHAPPSMNLDATQRIYAHLFFGRTADGGWWVRGLGFSLKDSQTRINATHRAKMRERIEEAAINRAASKPIPEWKLYFVPPRGCGDFAADVKAGTPIVANLIASAHKKAKELEPMLKNPIGPNLDSGADVGKESAKAFLGAILPGWIPSAVIGAENEGENVGGGAPAIKYAADAFDMALGILTEGDPLSGFGSIILGSFIEIGIANDAARVARIRGRLYLFYIAGVLSKLINRPRQKSKSKAEQTMFDLGVADAGALTPCGRYQVQLALLHYAATHNVANSWSFQTYMDKGWVFPTHYQLYWSPEMLARSLGWQLAKLQYLIK